MRDRLTTAAELSGLAAVVGGVAWIYPPAGLITLGVFIVLVSFLTSGGAE